MDTETSQHREMAPDRQYMMPGKSERPDAIPANKHDSADEKLSGILPNVRRKVNHEIGESYFDVHYVEQPAETLPMEELDAAITTPPYLSTDCQSVIANTVVPEKDRRNQSKSESLPTIPIHEPSPESCPDGMPQ